MQPKRRNELVLVVLYTALVCAVTVAHYGCEEPTEPDLNCGSGPFTYDSKTGICRDRSTGGIVNPDCCVR